MKRKDYLYSIILDQNTPELRKEFEDLGYSEMVGTGLAFNPDKGNCINYYLCRDWRIYSYNSRSY